MKLLHLNHHLPVTADVPFFALVDEELHTRLSEFRWMTTRTSPRPFRVFYCKDRGAAVTESLARHVWALTKGPVPTFLAHANGDLLDCRSGNLTEVASKRYSKTKATGKTFEPPLARDFRVNNGLPLDGGRKQQGRPAPFTPEQKEKLLRLREEIGQGMSVMDFNYEVIKEELGRPLTWRGLKKLFS